LIKKSNKKNQSAAAD